MADFVLYFLCLVYIPYKFLPRPAINIRVSHPCTVFVPNSAHLLFPSWTHLSMLYGGCQITHKWIFYSICPQIALWPCLNFIVQKCKHSAAIVAILCFSFPCLLVCLSIFPWFNVLTISLTLLVAFLSQHCQLRESSHLADKMMENLLSLDFR